MRRWNRSFPFGHSRARICGGCREAFELAWCTGLGGEGQRLPTACAGPRSARFPYLSFAGATPRPRAIGSSPRSTATRARAAPSPGSTTPTTSAARRGPPPGRPTLADQHRSSHGTDRRPGRPAARVGLGVRSGASPRRSAVGAARACCQRSPASPTRTAPRTSRRSTAPAAAPRRPAMNAWRSTVR